MDKQMNNPIPPRMLTIGATAAETGLAQNFIRKLCLENRIIYVRAGNKFLVNYDRLLDYLNAGDAVAETETRFEAIRPVGR